MAYATHSVAGAGILSAVRTRLSALAERYNAWRSYRRTYAELASLSNRELDDIGVARANIDQIARGEDLSRAARVWTF